VKVAVLVPRRADGGWRDQLWGYVRAWWEREFPEWPIVEGHHNDGPFNRSAAINQAARVADPWDVAVVVDSDSIPNEPEQVRAAVAQAAQERRMVVSYHRRLMLGQRGTQRVIAGRAGPMSAWERWVIKEWPDEQSGCIAVPRPLWDEVGGFDEMFSGWGWEDVGFRVACDTFGDGIGRVDGIIWHLWHPTSQENNTKLPGYQANERRRRRYHVALGNRDAVQKLLDERSGEPTTGTRIPTVFHRTVPEQIDPTAEAYWQRLQELHPGWTFHTHRDPLPPEHWPLTSHLWPKCQNGAQLAGLIRLEALVSYGGIYVDSDVEPARSFAPLLHLPGFAAWEDNRCVPDAVLGCEPGHPAFADALVAACRAVSSGRDAWHSGPGITTRYLRDRDDVLVLPPGAFYPFHYLDKQGRLDETGPWAFAAHRFHGSWLNDTQRASIKARSVR